MNCLFIAARGRKIRNSEPVGGCVQWAPNPQPPSPEGKGADIVTILHCAVATVSLSTYVTEGGGAFFHFPPGGSTYNRVGKTCLIFLPN